MATVDACFKYWGLKAGQAQKKLRDSDVPLPPTGRVGAEMKAKIEKDYLINDVCHGTMGQVAIITYAHKNEQAKQSYAQCLYMEHGRAWDPNGWFWSPAEDCARLCAQIS